MFSLMLYSLTSTTVSALVILYALATRIRFYPVVVFLFTSKVASASMMNQAIVLTILLGVGCVRLFLGKLRDAEWDAIQEQIRFTITETAFALTTFRDELNMRVGVLFGVMIFAKVFHLLNESRVEHVEQAHQTSWKAHLRIIALSLTLFTLNAVVLSGCSMHISSYGPSVYLLFAFEHAILLVGLFTTLAMYAIAVYDMNFINGRWQNKNQYEMVIALVSDALQFVAYVLFAGVVFTYYGFPIHLARPVWVAFRNLAERAKHLIRYLRIMRTLDQRFPDATLEELEATDKVCIICREDMEIGGPSGAPKKLQCGHLFHSLCLQNWLERQLSCPTCRRKIDIDSVQNAAANAAVNNNAAAAVQAPALQGNNAPAAAGAVAGAAAQAPEANPAAQQQQHTPVPEVAAQAQQNVPDRNAANEEAQVNDEGGVANAGAGARPTVPLGGGVSDTVQLIRQSLDRRFPVQQQEQQHVQVEEEKLEAPTRNTSSSGAPLSPPLTATRRPGGEVLFEDRDFARGAFAGRLDGLPSPSADVANEKLMTRLRLLQLEERVYQAQAHAAREAQEFALKVLQLQMQQQQQQ